MMKTNRDCADFVTINKIAFNNKGRHHFHFLTKMCESTTIRFNDYESEVAVFLSRQSYSKSAI